MPKKTKTPCNLYFRPPIEPTIPRQWIKFCRGDGRRGTTGGAYSPATEAMEEARTPRPRSAEALQVGCKFPGSSRIASKIQMNRTGHCQREGRRSIEDKL